MSISLLVPAGISVAVSTLLVVRAVRQLPQPPLVELAVLGVMATTTLTFGFADTDAAPPPVVVAVSLIAWLVLLFTYPDGAVRPRWLSVVLGAGVVAIVGGHLVDEAASLILPAFAIPFGVGAIGQVWRYRRRSSIRERQSTKWLLVGVIPALAVFLGIGLIASSTSLGPGAMETAEYLVLSSSVIWLVPWCAAVGVLAPEKGRVDPLIHALLVVTGSALVLTWGYFAAVPVLGPVWTAAATTMLVLPVAWVMRRIATRLVYASDPAPALAALGDRLRVSIEPPEVAAVVARTVADGLAVPYAVVSLATGVRHEVGRATNSVPERFPVLHNGEPVAEILVAPRPGDITLGSHDRAVLKRLAASAGSALHAAVMVQRLQAAREGLVLAREEERRRLRRELHDDLAPTLAGFGLQVASAAAMLDRDPAQVRRLHAELQEGIGSAVARIRDIAYDLRPPVLDDLGLMAAIRDRVATDGDSVPRIEVRGSPMETTLPAAVQVAALRIVQEAVRNVRRHAKAQWCGVELAQDDAWLVIRVSDDGIGLGPDRARGVGMQTMEERAAELGGFTSIDSGPAGTRFEARLPIGRSAS